MQSESSLLWGPHLPLRSTEIFKRVLHGQIIFNLKKFRESVLDRIVTGKRVAALGRCVPFGEDDPA